METNEAGRGRDPARTPMPWDGSPSAGFTAGTPWLPLSPDHPVRNVAAMSEDPRSILMLYRRLIALRREHPALQAGSYVPVACAGEVFAFQRRDGAMRLLVALNLGPSPQPVNMPGSNGIRGRILLSTALDREGEVTRGELALRPAEGVILLLSPDGAPSTGARPGS